MRLFAAVEISPDVEAELAEWWLLAGKHFDPQYWRQVKPAGWHLTLAYFGEVAGRDIDDLAESLAACAAVSPPLKLCCSGFGVFPRPQRPHVFWAGVDDVAESGAMRNLARCCRQAGHATVRKHTAGEAPFRGHITLARCRSDHGAFFAAPDLQALPQLPELAWTAGRFCLFQSVLHAEGAQYRRLETFQLSGRANRHA
ncbi:RNA 2',3'-cyclic phosphodiesterase [Mariprofundus erugo]|uniref:RNA 2',3'-cyclic phosphodiesterase n=1 Tax=Mariprofundus erugo TaxID=2528639 RepID=A0A5R9GPC6_9PROT|nr:RNA 2',3'-cyclic phosphodiesterase [Mariprofundus erugo]TLS67850.1 RNA 2',3'-cyclic phosphodiesterase [Mariprofundus erugo]